MACLNVKIIQTQISGEQRDVMEFSGTMQKVEDSTKTHYDIFLENGAPYLRICDINENSIELYFMRANTKLLLSIGALSDYVHSEQGDTLKLKILLKEKSISDAKITLVYQIHEQILLVENTLKIEVE